MYPTSKVRARLSRMNQCTPEFACRLNSKVPLASGALFRGGNAGA